MADLKFTLTGPQAEAAADSLAGLIQKQTEQEPTVMEAASESDRFTRDPALVVAIAALVVSIPAAVLACVQLADRLRKKEQAAVIIELSRELTEQNSGLRITVAGANGIPVRLETLQPHELVDMAIDLDEAD